MDSSIAIALAITDIPLPSAPPVMLSPAKPPIVRRPVALVAAPIAPPVAKPVRLQPNLGGALLLALGLVVAIVAVTVVWEAAAFIYAASVVGEVNPEKMMPVLREFGIANAEWILLSMFGVSLMYCLGVTAIAFRGQMFQKLSMRRCTKLQLLSVLMISLPLAVVITALAATLMVAIGIDTNPATQAAVDPPNLAIVILALCVAPAIGEEALFRGFLSRGLIARHGLILGVIFTTVLFAMVHLAPVQVMGIFFMGLVMQLVFLWTRSLPAAMLLHGVYNTLVITFSRNAPTGSALEVLEAAFLPMVLTALITLAALLVVLYQTRTRWLLPDGTNAAGTEIPAAELQAVAVNSAAKPLPLIIATAGFAALVVMTVLVVM